MREHERLEVEWAEANGLEPAGMVACASGTAALHLAFESLRPPIGSEILMPDFAMVACARAAAAAGCKPAFCDVRRMDLLADPVEALRTAGPDPGVAAMLHVANYGRPGPDWLRDDLAEVAKVARNGPGEAGIFGPGIYVEDLAEAHGVPPHPRAAAACWSFYANKIVAGEEGGAVWFRDHAAAAAARRLRSLGFGPAQDYRHVPRGWNHRLADSLAALVRGSIRAFPANVAARREAEAMHDGLCPAEWRMPPRAAPWVYDLRIPGLLLPELDTAVVALKEAGIAARHGFKPLSGQAEFQSCRQPDGGGKGGTRARHASREILYLPLAPGEGGRPYPAGSIRRAWEILERWREGA